jgi:protein-L-isoaspartate(D-aspartate) O-methyltransferase
MVVTQLAPRGITDERVLLAMSTVPRHEFVLPELASHAYDDMALRIGGGQTISQPYMVAAMTQALDLRGGERVLEIGTGSGYQTAVLAELAGEVFTIERHAALLAEARGRLQLLGYGNVSYRAADGTLGWPEAAPFDRILVTAGAPALPAPLIEQLKVGGIIVAPVGTRYSQVLLKGKKTPAGMEEEFHTPCVFVPLVGDHGWAPDE